MEFVLNTFPSGVWKDTTNRLQEPQETTEEEIYDIIVAFIKI